MSLQVIPKINKTLTIGYFYPELLNLYGDNGNVEILKYRAEKRGISVQVIPIHVGETVLGSQFESINLVFMGGGPDSGQKQMYSDLLVNKKNFMDKYVKSLGVGLYICGAYQLLGKYYKSADGKILEGLGILNLYTESFGTNKPRCIGNTVATISTKLTSEFLFPKTPFGNDIVGFENHGGRTYLSTDDARLLPFASIVKGNGNNSQDATEGAVFNNSIGTYFHGPLLAKNPHLADYLIYKALKLTEEEMNTLPKIDDKLVLAAHTASKKLKQ